MASSTRNLTDVPEEDAKSQISTTAPSSPYSATTPTASSSTLSVSTRTARKPPSIRTLGRSSNDQLPSASGSSVKRASSSSSSSTVVVANGSKTPRTVVSHSQIPYAPVPKFRANPHLPHDKKVAPAPATVMYWSRAPVWGTIPMRTMRAHTVTLVDTTAWIFGGCDDKDSSKDIYCFDTGMSFVSGRNFSLELDLYHPRPRFHIFPL